MVLSCLCCLVSFQSDNTPCSAVGRQPGLGTGLRGFSPSSLFPSPFNRLDSVCLADQHQQPLSFCVFRNEALETPDNDSLNGADQSKIPSSLQLRRISEMEHSKWQRERS